MDISVYISGFILAVLLLRVEVLSEKDPYILDVSIDCGTNKASNNPELNILTDIAISANAKCYGGDQLFTSVDKVNYNLKATLTSGSKLCRLNQRENSDVYAVEVNIHYGEVGSLILTKKKMMTLVCTYTEYGKDSSSNHTIIDGPIAPIERQFIIGGTVLSSDLKLSIQTVDDKDAVGSINFDRKYSLYGVYTGSKKNVGLKPVSCEATSTDGSKYAVLRAGCGDGLIFPKTIGFITTGTTFRSPYFEAFHLGTSGSLGFECNVTLCSPQCDGSSCEIYCGAVTPFPVSNGGLKGCTGNDRLNDRCEFVCNSGYTRVGDGISTCGYDGVWTLPRIKCNDINECTSNKGGCQHKCTNTPGSRTCSCNAGYSLNPNGRTCDDINECSKNKGGCQHKCTNTPGSRTCSCNAGYSLNPNGRTCDDINECSKNKGGCQHKCTNTPGSRTCSCNAGYSLNPNGRTCDDINECSKNKGGCQHRCTNTLGSRTCSCNAGYTLNRNGRTCDDINECNQNKGGCQHKCTNIPGSRTCSCNTGYTLNANRRTCDDINECLINKGGCEQRCANTPGSRNCLCNPGYILNINGRNCNDINECIANNGGCQQLCFNTPGSRNCRCRSGYRLNANGRTCNDLNECLTNKGGCQQLCFNIVGSRNCRCRSGYRINANGRTCDDLNECLTNKGGCQQLCFNTVGSRNCRCRSGYRINANGRTCDDINECLTNNGGCHHNCTNTPGSRRCACMKGFKINKDNTCTPTTAECFTKAVASGIPAGYVRTSAKMANCTKGCIEKGNCTYSILLRGTCHFYFKDVIYISVDSPPLAECKKRCIARKECKSFFHNRYGCRLLKSKQTKFSGAKLFYYYDKFSYC